MKSLLIPIVFILGTFSVFAQTSWVGDNNHTNIRFTATHMVIAEVDGVFRNFDIKVTSHKDDFDGSDVEFTADVGSIDTGNERRDGHLKSDDFFSAEQFPHIKFSGKLNKMGSKYQLKGDFTMRDVTKTETFDVVYNGSIATQRGRKAGFKLTGSVNRFDYGLKWDNAIPDGNLVAGENIAITCNVELNEVTQ